MLTKGDNNHGHDRVLYAKGQHWVSRNEIVGRAKGCGHTVAMAYVVTFLLPRFLPYIGMVTIIMNDYPMVKVCVYVWYCM